MNSEYEGASQMAYVKSTATGPSFSSMVFMLNSPLVACIATSMETVKTSLMIPLTVSVHWSALSVQSAPHDILSAGQSYQQTGPFEW